MHTAVASQCGTSTVDEAVGPAPVVVHPTASTHPTAVLHPGVRVGPGAAIGPGCVVGGPSHDLTEVGAEVVVGANTVVAAGVRLGVGAEVRPVSYVDRDVPPHAVVGGAPARIVGYSTTTVAGPAARVPSVPDGPVPLSVRGATLRPMRRAVDLRGALVAGELPDQLPFPVARFFMVFDVPGEHLRGEHAHRECHQLLLAAHGSVTVLVDDGRRRETVVLSEPDLGLHIEPGTWGVQYGYTRDAVLLVLASHPYDPDDYVRDYTDFQSRLLAQDQSAFNG